MQYFVSLFLLQWIPGLLALNDCTNHLNSQELTKPIWLINIEIRL